jgi:enoyl-CoA hydratase/carnithine racemase
MPDNYKTVPVPETYVTPADAHLKITNYPEGAPGVTPIIIVKLNRPEKLNALTGEMIYGLADLFEAVDVDDRVKAIILTGEGTAFCAGIDLNADTSQIKHLPLRDIRDPGGTLALAMFNCSKQVIVAYNGLSVGIGMTSTLAAAIRYVQLPMP